MKFTILIFLFLNIFLFDSYSQISPLRSKVNIKIGSSLFNSKTNEIDSEIAPLFYGSIGYNFNEKIELGLYAGTGRMMHALTLPYNVSTGYFEWFSKDSISYIRSGSQVITPASIHVRYGLVSELHILPLLNVEKVRFDVYIQPQLGLCTEYHEVLRDYIEHTWSKPEVEYGLGIGLRYRLSKSFGFFIDYSFGNFYNQDKHKIKSGIAITI